MALNLTGHTSLRPYLFHGTAKSNLASIREEFALHSASVLAPCGHTERGSFLRLKRGHHEIVLRDQQALKQGHVKLTGGVGLAKPFDRSQ